MKIARSVLLIVLSSVAVCFLVIKGCEYFPESSFELSEASRLPEWIVIPPGLERSDVSLTMNYSSLPIFGDAQFILRNKNGKTLAKLNCWTADLKRGPASSDYTAITEKGVTEVLELKPYREGENMEQNGTPRALFYVIDDPAIREELLAKPQKAGH